MNFLPGNDASCNSIAVIATPFYHTISPSLLGSISIKGENGIHNFRPTDPQHYDAAKRKVVPSSRSPVLPYQCSGGDAAPCADGRSQVQCCNRTGDVFGLNHYRVHGNNAGKLAYRDPRYWPTGAYKDPRTVSPHLCNLIGRYCAHSGSCVDLQ